jgi:RimJ/RimL family protein N-acetyltransferase
MDEDLQEVEEPLPEEGEEALPEEDETPTPPSDEVIALAEEPGLWLPDEPTQMVFHGDGFTFVASGRHAWVQRLRLQKGDTDGLQRIVNHVDAILELKKIDEAQWWIGEMTTPRNLTKRLLELGLERDTPARMTSLTIAKPPSGEPPVEVRRAETIEEWLQALEIDWECFAIADEERELRRRELNQAWERLQADGTSAVYLAYLDGEPVGFGRSIFTRHGTLLLGGATLPEARGQGVYTSIVHARWAHAAERDAAPRLVVCAGPESTPVLESLGFEAMGRVRLLRQKVT